MPTSPAFTSARFGLIANTQTFRSPLDGTVQTLELTGAIWGASYILPPMTRAEAAAWTAFLSDLLGQAGRFFGFDPDATTPRGSGGSDAPQVKGGSQTGKTLNTDTWTIDQTGLLLPGDFFEVNGELKKVTASVNSDGAGDATIAFTPSLRASPTDNALLTLNNPTCTMMLSGDAQAAWDIAVDPRYAIGFAGVETFV